MGRCEIVPVAAPHSSRRVLAGSILATPRAGAVVAISVTTESVSTTVRMVGTSYVIENAAHNAKRASGEEQSRKQSESSGGDSRPADVDHGLLNGRTQGHADADLARPLRYHLGHQRKDTNRAEQ